MNRVYAMNVNEQKKKLKTDSQVKQKFLKRSYHLSNWAGADAG
jgi:hypothetical protein